MVLVGSVYFLDQIDHRLSLPLLSILILLSQWPKHSLQQLHPLYVAINRQTNIQHLIKDFLQEPAMTVLHHHQFFYIQLHSLIVYQLVKVKGLLWLVYLLVNQANTGVELGFLHDLENLCDEGEVLCDVVL